MAQSAINLRDVCIPELVQKLHSDGVVCLENAVCPEWLEAARASVPEYIAQHGDRDFLVTDIAKQHGTPVHQLVATPGLKALFSEVAESGWSRVLHSDSIRNGLTVRSGSSGKVPGMLFHYDASAVTMVVPIVIPDGTFGDSGEFVALRNKRPFRRLLITHAIDKLATHNSWYRRRIVKKVFREPQRHVVNLKPGNAYLFWGYRTLHGNMPCAPNLLRSTLILEYGEVHRQTPALSLARVISRRKVRRLQITASRLEGDNAVAGAASTDGNSDAVRQSDSSLAC